MLIIDLFSQVTELTTGRPQHLVVTTDRPKNFKLALMASNKLFKDLNRLNILIYEESRVICYELTLNSLFVTELSE